MSQSVFTQSDGAIARVPVQFQDDKYLVRINFDGTQIPLPVTGFALEMGGNYQFLHTVSDFVYFYAFGDRISELNITGMAFIARSCGSGSVVLSRDGIFDVYDQYMERRATNPSKKMEAVRLTLGNIDTFWALVTGMRIEIPRADIPIAQWVMRLHVIPQK